MDYQDDGRSVRIQSGGRLCELLNLGPLGKDNLLQNWGTNHITSKQILVRPGFEVKSEDLFENVISFEMNINEYQDGCGPHGMIIGEDDRMVRNLLRTMIISLCMRYSPDDIEIVVFDGENTDAFHGLEYLPHIRAIARTEEEIYYQINALRKGICDREYAMEQSLQCSHFHYNDWYAKQTERIGNYMMSHKIVIVHHAESINQRCLDAASTITSILRMARSCGYYGLLTYPTEASVSNEVSCNTGYRLYTTPFLTESIPAGRYAEQTLCLRTREQLQWFCLPMDERKDPQRNTVEKVTVEAIQTASQTREWQDQRCSFPHEAPPIRWQRSQQELLSQWGSNHITSNQLSIQIGYETMSSGETWQPCKLSFEDEGWKDRMHWAIICNDEQKVIRILREMILSASVQYSSDDVVFAIFNGGETNAFDGLEKLPHITAIASGEEKIEALVKTLNCEQDEWCDALNKSNQRMREDYNRWYAEQSECPPHPVIPRRIIIVHNMANLQTKYPNIMQDIDDLLRHSIRYKYNRIDTWHKEPSDKSNIPRLRMYPAPASLMGYDVLLTGYESDDIWFSIPGCEVQTNQCLEEETAAIEAIQTAYESEAWQAMRCPPGRSTHGKQSFQN